MRVARYRSLILLAALVASRSFGGAAAALPPLATLRAAAVTIGPYVQAIGPYALTVCWETDEAVPTRLHWGATQDCSVTYEDAVPATRHEVSLSGLRAATVCWYRLDDAGAPGGAVPVRTQPDHPVPVRVGAFGDTRTNDAAHAQVVADLIADSPDLSCTPAISSRA